MRCWNEFYIQYRICVLQQQNSRDGHDVSALSALMSGCYGSSGLSHKHLATLIRDTVYTRSIEELIYLTSLNVMMIFFTSTWIVLILCLPTNLLILLKMECLWGGTIQRYTLNFIITIHKVLDPFCITSYPSVPLNMFLNTLILLLFTNISMFISRNFHLTFLQQSCN
jgi:hypothetical protein